MCDSHSSSINLRRQRTDLTLQNVQPINYPPFRAGPKRREFQKAKIDKVETINVLKHGQSEWLAPILFSKKKQNIANMCWLLETKGCSNLRV